jgi:hypothetical protein
LIVLPSVDNLVAVDLVAAVVPESKRLSEPALVLPNRSFRVSSSTPVQAPHLAIAIESPW